MNRRQSLALALCIVVFGAGCRMADPLAAPRTERFVVLADAQNVRFTRENDGGVMYRLADPYPAERTIQRIGAELEARGWKPMDDDPLNPGRPSCRVAGWGSYQEPDGTAIHQWIASWRDRQGNTITYSFQYRGHEKGTMSFVEVQAAFLFAETLDVLQKAVKKGD